MSTPPKPDETIQLTVEVPLGGGMHRPLHGTLLDTETGAALDDAAHEAALRDSVLRTPR